MTRRPDDAWRWQRREQRRKVAAVAGPALWQYATTAGLLVAGLTLGRGR